MPRPRGHPLHVSRADQPGVAQAVPVVDRPFEHVGYCFNPAVRVHREPSDRAFQRIVKGEMIEKQERVQRISRLGAIDRRSRTPPLQYSLRIDNPRYSPIFLHDITPEKRHLMVSFQQDKFCHIFVQRSAQKNTMPHFILTISNGTG